MKQHKIALIAALFLTLGFAASNGWASVNPTPYINEISPVAAPPSAMAASTISAPASASMPAHGHEMVVLRNVQDFTHTAALPVGADTASIRLLRVKLVSLPTRTRSTTDLDYCAEAALREPGGSMRCPSIQQEGFARAIEATYSFEGQPLASDESGNRNFTFAVYFHPEEFSAKLREVLLRSKGRANDAELFHLTISWEPLTREVVDYQNSTFCAGAYSDGVWTRTNPGCEDNVKLKTILVPAPYLTVRVEPAAPSHEEASTSAY